MKPSVKKIIIWGLVVLFIIGSILVGGPFDLIGIVITRPIMNILFVIFNLVSSIGWDFGGAIIVFAVLVKLCMWPLTKRQLKQTRLMRKIQPELTQIRKNCNGNKQMESLQTMDLYKRYNVKPFSSILVLFIQLPIFIAVVWSINAIATPAVNSNYNLQNWAYEIVAWDGSEIADLREDQNVYLAEQVNEEIPAEEKAEYHFRPTLFGVVDLTAKASDVISPTKFSWSAVFMLVIAVGAAVAQWWVTKQQMPSGKSEKKKKFREILNEAKEGKDIDESEISNLSTQQMSKMMPIMMFIIMFSLHGALAFYYFLSNILTILQQKVMLRKVEQELDNNTDRAMTRELKKIQEAEVVNKKTGTKMRTMSARDAKERGSENRKGGSEKSASGASSAGKGGSRSKEKRSKK